METMIEIKKISCCRCGILFWIEKEVNDIYLEDKRLFYCPQGHGQKYRGESYQQTAQNLRIDKTHLERDAKNTAYEITRLLKKIQGYKGCIGRMKKRRGLK